jgi:hypothetical protein
MGLYGSSEAWQIADGVFDSLPRSFPGFDRQSTLLKATVVNALYSTNVYAIARMAEHVEKLIRARGSLPADADFVEQLASPPGLKPKFYSFASKFAHFFIDAERFPIYDSYAVPRGRPEGWRESNRRSTAEAVQIGKCHSSSLSKAWRWTRLRTYLRPGGHFQWPWHPCGVL